MPTAQPNQSLYVKNINTKVKKPELRRQLYSLFSTYGKVLDVVATRADGMRGQAFVVFRDLQSATAAMRGLEGFEFYDSPLSIDYARTKSKAALIEELGPEAAFDPTLLKGGAPKVTQKVTMSSAQADAKGKRMRDEAGEGEEEEEEEEEAGREVKKIKPEENGDDEEEPMEEDSDTGSPPPGPGPAEAAASAAVAPAPVGPPLPSAGEAEGPTLFSPNVPSEVTDDMLAVLFQQYPGYRSVTVFPASRARTPPFAYAFIEFDNASQASVAKEALDGFLLDKDGKKLVVRFAARAPVAEA